MATVKRLAAQRARPKRKGDTERKPTKQKQNSGFKLSLISLKLQLLPSIIQNLVTPVAEHLNYDTEDQYSGK